MILSEFRAAPCVVMCPRQRSGKCRFPEDFQGRSTTNDYEYLYAGGGKWRNSARKSRNWPIWPKTQIRNPKSETNSKSQGQNPKRRPADRPVAPKPDKARQQPETDRLRPPTGPIVPDSDPPSDFWLPHPQEFETMQFECTISRQRSYIFVQPALGQKPQDKL